MDKELPAAKDTLTETTADQPPAVAADTATPTPAQPERDQIIVAQRLTKVFEGQIAVEDVTFKVPRGEIFGFIGPSGSGKTTTIRLLTGILAATGGTVTVLGRSPSQFDERTRMRIGYMPQSFVLYRDLTVAENMDFAASLYGMSPLRGKQMRSVLDLVELTEHRHKLAREISGGMQRRLSLAATLIHNPELIFLDEPTAGVDPVLRKKFWDHFRQLQKEGRTLFITTQYVGETEYCDQVAVMTQGHLLTVDTPQGLRRQAFHGDIVEIKAATPISWQVEQEIAALPAVKGTIVRFSDRGLRLTVVDAATAIPAIIARAKELQVDVESVGEFHPPFDDVFLEIVNKGANGG